MCKALLISLRAVGYKYKGHLKRTETSRTLQKRVDGLHFDVHDCGIMSQPELRRCAVDANDKMDPPPSSGS
jgi:hypothetical protein